MVWTKKYVYISILWLIFACSQKHKRLQEQNILTPQNNNSALHLTGQELRNFLADAAEGRLSGDAWNQRVEEFKNAKLDLNDLWIGDNFQPITNLQQALRENKPLNMQPFYKNLHRFLPTASEDVHVGDRIAINTYKEMLSEDALKDALKDAFISINRNSQIGTTEADNKAYYSNRNLELIKVTSPTYIKLLQSHSDREEFSTFKFVKNDLPPIDFETVKKDIKKAFGDNAIVTEKPLGCASIGCAYTVTVGKESYVVKVKRSNLRSEKDLERLANENTLLIEKIENKIQQLEDIANPSKAEIQEKADYLTAKTTVQQRYQTTLEELNFANENKNIWQAAVDMNPSDMNTSDMNTKEKVPKVRSVEQPKNITIDSNDLIIMKKAPGDSLSKFLDNFTQLDPDKQNKLRKLYEAYLRDWFQRAIINPNGLFHADPHPGNIFVDLDNNIITQIDLGAVGRITPENQKSLVKLFTASTFGDKTIALEGIKEIIGETNFQDAFKTFNSIKFAPKEDTLKRMQSIFNSISTAQKKYPSIEFPSWYSQAEKGMVALFNTADTLKINIDSVAFRPVILSFGIKNPKVSAKIAKDVVAHKWNEAPTKAKAGFGVVASVGIAALAATLLTNEKASDESSSTNSTASPTPAPSPAPAPTPAPSPTPAPTPSPTPAPAPSPAPTQTKTPPQNLEATSTVTTMNTDESKAQIPTATDEPKDEFLVREESCPSLYQVIRMEYAKKNLETLCNPLGDKAIVHLEAKATLSNVGYRCILEENSKADIDDVLCMKQGAN